MGRELGDPCPFSQLNRCPGTLVKIDPSKSREWTQKEIQTQFLKQVSSCLDYWRDLPEGKFEAEDPLLYRMEGLVFSILNILDGTSMSLPAFNVIPSPHPLDMEYAKELGDNWYPQLPAEVEKAVDVHGKDLLHELWHGFRKDQKEKK
jgi:hypothetical protein